MKNFLLFFFDLLFSPMGLIIMIGIGFLVLILGMYYLDYQMLVSCLEQGYRGFSEDVCIQ